MGTAESGKQKGTWLNYYITWRAGESCDYLIERQGVEMNKNTLRKLFWVFWCTTTILTGILAGFLVSHAIMLGRFFQWFLESGNEDLLHQTYTVFRAVGNPHIAYNIPLYLAFVSGIIWTVLAFIARRDRIIAVTAGLSTTWVGAIFFISHFAEAEEAVLTATADARLTELYTALNLPLHTLFAAMYVVSLFLLLLVALKGQWPKAQKR